MRESTGCTDSIEMNWFSRNILLDWGFRPSGNENLKLLKITPKLNISVVDRSCKTASKSSSVCCIKQEEAVCHVCDAVSGYCGLVTDCSMSNSWLCGPRLRADRLREESTLNQDS